jgi:putative holliday junction resolvase
MKLLGIDFGTKRVGLAVGETESRVAVPFLTLEIEQDFWGPLTKLVQEEAIDELVVGMPRSLKDAGTRGKTAQLVQVFIEELKTHIPLPVHEEDERLSSALADRYVKESGGDRDAVAAATILQTYLDRIKNPKS